MKKILTVSLAILTLTAALTSCSGSNNETTLPQETNTASSVIQESESYYQVSAEADTSETKQSYSESTEEPVSADENDIYFVG